MLKLVDFDPKFSKEVIGWFSCERDFYLWCGKRFTYPISENDFLSYVPNGIDRNNFRRLMLVKDDEIIAFACTEQNQKDLKNVGLCLIVLSPKMRHQGLGKTFVKMLTDYAFDNLFAGVVSLSVFENNINAKNCYLSLGFLPNGEKTQFETLGETWQYVRLQKIK